MKLLSVIIENFGSYKYLEFDFSDAGLALLYGKTGSGKSTITDIPFWIMFGQTAKECSADEVRSWGSDTPTKGILTLEIESKILTITRVRGKPADNDLYYALSPNNRLARGKDLLDTQKIINEILGVDAYSYALTCYYSECSPAANFFHARAKDRREVFEQIADLSLPTNLEASISEKKKVVSKAIICADQALARQEADTAAKIDAAETTTKYKEAWEEEQKSLIESLQVKYKAFDEEKASKVAALATKADAFDTNKRRQIDSVIDGIEALDSTMDDEKFVALDDRLKSAEDELALVTRTPCKTCGGPSDSKLAEKWRKTLKQLTDATFERQRLKERRSQLLSKLEDAQATENTARQAIADAQSAENLYGERLEVEKAKVNPFLQRETADKERAAEAEKTLAIKKQEKAELDNQLNLLKQLGDFSTELRGILLDASVSAAERSVNDILTRFFDAEIKVQFTLENSDKLEVSIQKSGHACSYEQLSKGQKGLLKLAFAVSLMKASSDRLSVQVENLFFDEALDGLDTELKVKAFGLFQELRKTFKNIFLVEHAQEFQTLFDTKFHVQLEGDYSIVSSG